jgi:hypothetical protein
MKETTINILTACGVAAIVLALPLYLAIMAVFVIR